MDMLSKLKTNLTSYASSTITNTVYSTGNIISGVLPGNPVTRDFEVTAHIASAGPSLLWKVYSAVKKSTRQPASVFVLERALLDRFEKSDREVIWEMMRKGVGQLTRLRHPRILTVQHPLEESRDCLAFATEPVFASLANILGQQEQLPSPVPEQLRGHEMFDIEVKYGLLQVAEGLGFLHDSAKMLHRNISPEAVLVNLQGAWKICGFEYCLANTGAPGQEPSWTFPEYDHGQPAETYPQLDYLAPEYSLLGAVTPAADLFSLGMLAYTVFHKRPLLQSNRTWGVYKRNCQELRSLPSSRLHQVPAELREHLKLLLSVTPELRLTPEQVQQLPYFDDFGVKTLASLDSQFQWDNLQKSQFYKGLPAVLARLPPRVALHRVYPCLAKEFVNPDMVPFVLPSALNIAQEASKADYLEYVLPDLKPVMRMMEPIQILLIFMQRMELLLDRTPPEDVRTDVLPMVYRALESGVSQIQELCLSVIPSFAGLLDRQSLKASLLPRIRKLCTTTTLLSVRVNSLICIGKLLEHMDKWQVMDDVLPALPQIPSKEPAVIMAIAGIYKLAFSNPKLGLTKEVMANKALPFLIPLSIENGLTVAQYTSITSIIREMMAKVEAEHRTKLEQLNSIQDEGKKSLSLNSQALPPGQLVAAPSAQEASSMDSMYTSLGLSSYLSPTSPSSPSPPRQLPPSQALPSPAQALSVEEKQRILASQESLQREAINPGQPVAKAKPQPMMAQTVSQLNSAPMGKPSSAGLSMQIGQNMAMSQNLPLGQSMPMSQSMPMGLSMPMGQPMSLNQARPMGHTLSSNQKPPPPDLSAFDNLLTSSSSSSSSRPIGMGAMATSSTGGMGAPRPMGLAGLAPPLLAPAPAPAPSRPLSSTDIKDFLS